MTFTRKAFRAMYWFHHEPEPAVSELPNMMLVPLRTGTPPWHPPDVLVQTKLLP
jgi:hypothetical protein